MSEYIIDMSSSSYNSESGLLCADVSQLREVIVRCRDCKYMFDWAYDRMLCKMWADGGMDDDARNVLYPTVKPDGFCFQGKPRSDAE